MMIERTVFGCTGDGRQVDRYLLKEEDGTTASVLSYGATWQSMWVRGRDGALTDVLLGYDTLEEYEENQWYFGATIGRVANRVDGGAFALNGREYKLFQNDGAASSHGGKIGFDRRVFTGSVEEDALRLSYVSPDGEEGFPGTLSLAVIFRLKDHALTIRYEATTDADTIVNLTNHAYFNLNGQGGAPVTEHLLTIAADTYTEIREDIVPTGRILPVADTALDFRNAKPIGRDIGANEANLPAAGGYDHNFVLRVPENRVCAADAYAPKSGIRMRCATDQPGVQLYTPGDLGGMAGKHGARYGMRPAFCLETQHFADAVHHASFPSTVLAKGELFASETTYSFSTVE